MSAADIRKGDLVKATRKDDPETTVTGRAREVDALKVRLPTYGAAHYDFWDFEVLDRPLPPIDRELLNGGINAWRKGYYDFRPVPDVAADKRYREAVTAVINFVRKYDAEHNNKESNA